MSTLRRLGSRCSPRSFSSRAALPGFAAAGGHVHLGRRRDRAGLERDFQLGKPAVPGSGDVAQFAAGSYSLAASTPTLGSTANLGGIWDTGAGVITIGGSALTLYGTTINSNTAGGIEVDSSAGSLTINAPLVLQNNQN